MSTHERYWAAVRHANRLAIDVADKLDPSRLTREWGETYERIWTRELGAFRSLEALRRPLPNQAEIDKRSAEILTQKPTPDEVRQLKASQGILGDGVLDMWQAKFEKYHTTANSCACPDWSVRGAFRGDIKACKHMIALRLLKENRCPECDTPITTGTRCVHCQGE